MKPAGLLMHSQVPAACPVPILSQIDPVHACPSHFWRLILILSSQQYAQHRISFFKKGSHLQGLDTKFYGISTLNFHCTVKNKHSNHTTVLFKFALMQANSAKLGLHATFNSLYRKKKEWVYVNKIVHIISLVFFLNNISNNKCRDNNKST